ncbi:hypothetical protein COEREDRAFT_12366 [Coemansia reversa NRRL 1564]|uniref:Uncharacterized protein n=1 Tax=Coemansia reversa (strain ATCC 12441 / NRRL 1564) TaxID=763665 RepID=A0A2G5B0Y9_COERN|nr:hypothetical protein COEREDRAFT_12366 [Coemansia reversa NRRL 1564]|eukprot:PIA12681.1 hypothetical protein COEREDRAFT_12366 [Coemansia reversa NRRL 1564]
MKPLSSLKQLPLNDLIQSSDENDQYALESIDLEAILNNVHTTESSTEDRPVIEYDESDPEKEDEPPILAKDVLKAMALVEHYTKHKGANDYHEFEHAWTKISMDICADVQQQHVQSTITKFFKQK